MKSILHSSVLAIIIAAGGFGIAAAQEQCPDPTILSMGTDSVDPCIEVVADIPVYMDNPCAVGGFEIHIQPADMARFSFDPANPSSADRNGSRIEDWDFFAANIEPGDPSELVVSGIADLPGGNPDVYLPPGNGLIFTAHLRFVVYASSDTELALAYPYVQVVDTTGYIIYDNVLQGNNVGVLSSPCDSNPRGDCNCNGELNGIDVTYLVGFLKGSGVPICGRCSGDANSSGSVNGIDVTFLVSYLKGTGSEPGPCN
jgi:hypothetical protein